MGRALAYMFARLPGLRMEVEDRGPLEGYVDFFGRCLLYEFDLPCPEGQCAAGPMSLEVRLERC